MARRGNGAGHGGPARGGTAGGSGWGPANGMGWGGPAGGIGHNSSRAQPFELSNTEAGGAHSMHRSERGQVFLNMLYEIALHDGNGMVRVRACTAALDRLEGPCRPMIPLPRAERE